MKYFTFLAALFFNISFLSATEFTISSYNCGGLSSHYDYLRAASMEKLMQERYMAEPEQMHHNEKIQQLALKILFSEKDKSTALQEWDQKGYQALSERLTATPSAPGSPNNLWNEKADAMITSYRVRPVIIRDQKVNQMLEMHLGDLTKTNGLSFLQRLQEARKTMATRIFANHLPYDIICMQEADYLDPSMFPKHMEVLFAESSHSINGVAWNTMRFELARPVGDILGRAFAVQLRDKESGKTVLVISGHLSGCNPYRMAHDPATGISDSARGDHELQTLVDLFDSEGADFAVIGMDANVTALHPRLSILKEAGFSVDYENYLEATCTNPYQVLNTRIDWIALKSKLQKVSITNIPVLSVGLNSIQTNISDHKPIAAKIKY
ncbi:MAG: hypothetical protein JSR46_04935 [Verrucomicrobia bacterium]|nr:hypothetical protein [Verrucomicrobiota bacterium]